MLKIRLQGTKNDIRWFIRLLQRDKRLDLENVSTFFNNAGTERYKRVYAEVYRSNIVVDPKRKIHQAQIFFIRIQMVVKSALTVKIGLLKQITKGTMQHLMCSGGQPMSMRHSLAYSSGSSIARAFNAQSEQGVVFKFFSASQQSMRSIQPALV